MSGRTLVKLRNAALVVMILGEAYIIFSKVIDHVWRWINLDRSPDWWGASGQWAGAIGTVATVIVALVIAIGDRRITSKESRVRDERELRDHISQLSAWPVSHRHVNDELDFPIKLLNASKEPFYNVVVFPVFIQGAAPHTGEQWLEFTNMEEYGHRLCTVIALLPSGKWEIVATVDSGVMQGRVGVEIAATDRLGKHWIRRCTGELQAIPTNPIEYYGIERPIQYETPSEDGSPRL